MKKKLSEERIVGVLKHVEMGVPMAELIRKIEITEQTYHRWKAEYAGLESIMSGRLRTIRLSTVSTSSHTIPLCYFKGRSH